MHVRTQIRNALEDVVTGLSSTGNRVAVNRSRPKPSGNAIDIVVRTPSEASQDMSMSGTQSRVMSARLDVSTKGASERAVADALDQSALEIETAVMADTQLGGLAQTTEYRGAQLIMATEGERHLGTLSILFDVTVYTAREHPETAL